MDNALSFSAALVRLRKGDTIARAGWNAHHTLSLQGPDANSKMGLPYIYMTVGADAADLQGKNVPWVASHTDLLADDWFVATEAE